MDAEVSSQEDSMARMVGKGILLFIVWCLLFDVCGLMFVVCSLMFVVQTQFEYRIGLDADNLRFVCIWCLTFDFYFLISIFLLFTFEF